MKKIVFIFVLALSLVGLTSCKKANVANAGEPFQLYSIEKLKEHQGPIKVEFWHSFGHVITKPLDEMIRAFEKEMKSQGIEIKVNAQSVGGGYDGLRSRVNIGTRSNAIPTMLLGYPDHFSNYINNDILQPLDPFIQAESADIALPNGGVEDFVESYWNEVKVKDKNQKDIIAGIPFNKSTEIMVYNANVVDRYLKQLNIVEKEGDAWENPTWEQVMEVSKAIKSDLEKGPIKWHHKFKEYSSTPAAKSKFPVIVDSTSNLFITATRQWGGAGYYTRTTSTEKGGEAVFDNGVVREALGFFQTNAKAGYWQIPEKIDESYGSKPLVVHDLFITIGSTAGIKNNTSKTFETKVTTYPQRASATDAEKAVIQQGTNAAILSKNSNNYTRLAAWLLIRYLTNTANTSFFSQETGYLPVRNSTFESDEYKEFMAAHNDPYTGEVARAVTAAAQSRTYSFTDPAFPGSSIVRDEVGELMIAVFVRNESIDNAITNAYRKLEQLKIQTVKLKENE